MEISNPSDILAMIKVNIFSNPEKIKPIINIVSNNYIQDGILHFPIKIDLIDYLEVLIQLNGNCNHAILSLCCVNNDGSDKFKEASDIVTYLARSMIMPARDFKAYKDGVIYNYMSYLFSIEDIVSSTITFIKQIYSALERYKVGKINWDSIVGMKEGSFVFLTDNVGNPVTDQDGEQIVASYIGNNMLKSMDVTGPSDMLAMLLINTYGKSKAKMFCDNGDNCWTFNGKKINECEITELNLPFPKKEETTEKPVKNESATIAGVKDISDYNDTYTLTVQKFEKYDTNRPYSTVDCITINTSWRVDSKYTPVSYIVKEGSSFHYIPRHKCLENDKSREAELQKLVDADVLAVRYTKEDILYTFTRDIVSAELSNITGATYTLNKLAKLIGLSINIWEKHPKYFVNKDGKHISEFYHKKYFTL